MMGLIFGVTEPPRPLRFEVVEHHKTSHPVYKIRRHAWIQPFWSELVYDVPTRYRRWYWLYPSM